MIQQIHWLALMNKPPVYLSRGVDVHPDLFATVRKLLPRRCRGGSAVWSETPDQQQRRRIRAFTHPLPRQTLEILMRSYVKLSIGCNNTQYLSFDQDKKQLCVRDMDRLAASLSDLDRMPSQYHAPYFVGTLSQRDTLASNGAARDLELQRRRWCGGTDREAREFMESMLSDWLDVRQMKTLLVDPYSEMGLWENCTTPLTMLLCNKYTPGISSPFREDGKLETAWKSKMKRLFAKDCKHQKITESQFATLWKHINRKERKMVWTDN